MTRWVGLRVHPPPSVRKKEGMNRAAFLVVVLVLASSTVALAKTANFPGGTLDVSWVDDAMLSRRARRSDAADEQ